MIFFCGGHRKMMIQKKLVDDQEALSMFLSRFGWLLEFWEHFSINKKLPNTSSPFQQENIIFQPAIFSDQLSKARTNTVDSYPVGKSRIHRKHKLVVFSYHIPAKYLFSLKRTFQFDIILASRFLIGNCFLWSRKSILHAVECKFIGTSPKLTTLNTQLDGESTNLQTKTEPINSNFQELKQ